MDNLDSAGARQPDALGVSRAIQVATPLELSDKGHQGVEHVRHGAGRFTQLRENM